jgi:hypothetical protein
LFFVSSSFFFVLPFFFFFSSLFSGQTEREKGSPSVFKLLGEGIKMDEEDLLDFILIFILVVFFDFFD